MAQLKIKFSQLKQQHGYSVHHAILDPNIICNVVGPDTGCQIGWDDDTIKKRKSRAAAIIKKRNDRDNFFNKLESSILANGFINPVMIYSGKSAFVKLNTLPKVMQKNVDNILLCIHGGSRLYYAQKHNMKIPCVICEWRSRFSDTQKILTESAFVSLYNTPPRFIITQSGLRILELKNTHMP